MGKIIINGIPYGGSNDNASGIMYDNSYSELDARNVQDAISELGAQLEEIGMNLDDLNQEAIAGKQAIADVLTNKGLSASVDLSFEELANLISVSLYYIAPVQTLKGSHSGQVTVIDDYNTAEYLVPFASITENDVISVAAGTFTVKIPIKKLEIIANTNCGYGSTGTTGTKIYCNNSQKAFNSKGSGGGDVSTSYVWNNVSANSTFNVKAYFNQGNAGGVYKNASFTLNVTL